MQRRTGNTENRFQSLLNRLNLGVFRTTLAGELLEGNAAFLRLLQVNSLPEAQEIYLQQLYIRREISSSTLEWKRELQLRLSDSSTVWVLLSEILSINDGETVIDGLLENISDRKSSELQILQNNENLERRVREYTVELEAANQDLKAFTTSVSHDLREPLRAIQGFAGALLEDYSDLLPADGQNYAQRIVAAANRLDTLIQDLLIYSRLGRAEVVRSQVDLSAVVAEALTFLEVEIQQRQAQISVEKPLPTVIGDYPTLLQVIINLLTNTIKFVAPEVQPQVRVWAKEVGKRGKRAELDNYEPGIPNSEFQFIRLWVEDNGIGIAPEYQERIFRVFERLHGVESYPGSGIGLAIASKGMERMGGRVGVESQLGMGSRFWLELPLASS